MRRISFLFACLLASLPVQAAEDLVLGQSIPLSGPLEPAGRAIRSGIEAYLKRVNAAGGVAGRQVTLKTLDDGYEVERHVANVRQLLEEDHVEALVLSAGTSQVEAAYPLIQKSGKPLVGTISGSSTLRSADKRLIFHVRAGYADEVKQMLAQMDIVGQATVFAVWQNDGLGKDAFGALQQHAAAHHVKVVGQAPVHPTSMDAAAVSSKIRQAKPDAVALLCITPCAAAMVSKLAAEGGWRGAMYALSVVNGEGLAKVAGESSRGVIITQVMPNPQQPNSPFVRQYQQDLRAHTGKSEYSYFSLEGYVNAMVAVEGLRGAQAGGGRSVAAALAALNSREFEGGVMVSAGDQRPPRPRRVDLSLINGDGKLVH
ncbi:ABC transporter substrate-binding protein [Aquabacterium sp. A7-Y]|uniref:ABC transporter substrate-binding protein n=1 Tax=Aquabacterium sp. A7-Y TaxID=1349605 RepID=UPI00223CAF1E|nr:ABC transporter substrate-binding protein [Aquabacterium sp. A7-Y]MCW7542048.1 ABC transporter substrate-binding protein [Aquabacterium sp. A7-Y]